MTTMSCFAVFFLNSAFARENAANLRPCIAVIHLAGMPLSFSGHRRYSHSRSDMRQSLSCWAARHSHGPRGQLTNTRICVFGRGSSRWSIIPTHVLATSALSSSPVMSMDDPQAPQKYCNRLIQMWRTSKLDVSGVRLKLAR